MISPMSAETHNDSIMKQGDQIISQWHHNRNHPLQRNERIIGKNMDNMDMDMEYIIERTPADQASSTFGTVVDKSTLVSFSSTSRVSSSSLSASMMFSFLPNDSVSSLQLCDLEDLELMSRDNSSRIGSGGSNSDQDDVDVANPGGLWSSPRKRPPVAEDESQRFLQAAANNANDAFDRSYWTAALHEQRCKKAKRTSRTNDNNSYMNQSGGGRFVGSR